MELMFDWRSFQSTFHPARRTAADAQKDAGSCAFLVVEGDRIVTAYAEQENLQEWVGTSLTEAFRQNPHREWRVVQKESVHRAVAEGMSQPQFYDQVEYLRSVLKSDSQNDAVLGQTTLVPTQQSHFLVDTLRSWWRRLLPTAYGLCLQLTSENGGSNRHRLLLVRRGKLEGFHEPDLSVFKASGRKAPEELSKYLSERYMLPVITATVPNRLWVRWSQDLDPWSEVASALFKKQVFLSTRSWGLRLLILLRAAI